MGYVVGWLAFALLSFHLAPMFGCGPRWPRFIAAWNWCNVIENLLLVVGGIPGLLGAPTIIDEAAQIVAIGWALWIEWFATRQALGTTSLVAVLLVVAGPVDRPGAGRPEPVDPAPIENLARCAEESLPPGA